MDGILFVCVENRARSQMAEGLARHFLGHSYEVFSAGSQPADKVHAMAKAVMAEIGIDISKQKPKSLAEVNWSQIQTVIFLCAEESCPSIPANVKKINWEMGDPAKSDATPEDQIRKFRKVRDDLRKKIIDLRSSNQTW